MPRVLVKFSFEEIRFECQRCGACCHHRRPAEFGDLVPSEDVPDFVAKSNLIYLTERDIHRICRRARCRPEKFVDTLYEYDGCCVKIGDSGRKVILDLPVMKSKQDTTCVFYEKGCTIYNARPNACRLFPFRVEEKTDAQGDITLNISCNESCPGVGKGEVVDGSKLEKLVRDQFIQRTEDITPRIRSLAARGMISQGFQVYRAHPGRKDHNH